MDILECPSLLFEDSAKSVAEYLGEHIESLNNKVASELYEKIKDTDYQGRKEVVYDLLALLNCVTDPKLRNYLHNISFKEYQMSMDMNGITEEMWEKANRHLMKLLEIRPTEKITMLDNFLSMIQRTTLPVLLINGKYDPAYTKYQTEYIISNVQNVTQVVFENSGHFPRIEESEKYTNTILSFLENLTGNSGLAGSSEP